jgi:uncharacterized RDD family membrane protein YckC
MVDKLTPPSLLRHFMIIFYETMLLFSVLFLAGMLVYPITQAKNSPGYSLYLFCVCFLYFGWQWTHGGQTLAMGTWHVKLQAINGEKVTWQQAVIRFFVAIVSWFALGLGFFWAIFDKEQRTWHDIASGTRLVKLPKNYYKT